MTVKSLLLILLGGVLANNYALQKFLGVTPFLGYSRDESRIAGMGLAVTVVMILTAAVTWPVETFLLAKLGLDYLQTLVFIALILILVYLVDLVVKKLMHKSLGVYFPLIALNSAVLGLALEAGAKGYSYGQTLAAALGVGLGFLVALLLMNGVQSRIEEKHIPAAFRGLPISLLAASIIAMVLVAFK